MPRLSFREQVLKVREDAIVTAVNRLLADKGFDLMTVDEVAAEVGIAKASLYKHFPSKEALAAEAMVRVLQRTLGVIEQQAARAELSAAQRLEAVTRWALQVQIAGEMPTLPSQNSTLREELMANKTYLDLLMQVSDRLGAWIVQGQSDGELDATLPPEVILYTVYARACDPVPGFLKAGGQYDDAQIVDFVMAVFMTGLRGRKAAS
jgi:TetR/AcrR family transcriptional regulator, regulator of autoinduction and epiphytic fitness